MLHVITRTLTLTMFFLCLDTHTQDELLVDDKIHELFRYEVVRTVGYRWTEWTSISAFGYNFEDHS